LGRQASCLSHGISNPKISKIACGKQEHSLSASFVRLDSLVAQASSLLGRQASCLSFSASFVRVNHASPDAPNLRVMREHVDTPVAPAKERAQYPADDADNNRAPERAGKRINVKTDNDARHNEEHQAVYNQNE
jgi:hypothetical protein